MADNKSGDRPWLGRLIARGTAVASFAALVLVAGCSSSAVHVLSPVTRYDHNRTRPLCVVTTDAPAPCSAPAAPADPNAAPLPQAPKYRFGTESYAPQSVEPFSVQYVQADKPADALPPAQLVPIFTGVALPLSSAPIAGCEVCTSDRSDLTDFLATGPGALAGVDAPETQGDVTSTSRRAAGVLDRLSQPDIVKQGRDQLEELFSTVADEWADQIFDSRYAAPAFLETLGFRWEKFWFVLYRFPGNNGFTRLVVVPTELEQDLKAKRPGVQ